ERTIRRVAEADAPRPHEPWLRLAIDAAERSVATGGGPFAALVILDDRVIATGTNRVTATNDPTAHAEIVAIRDACRALGSFRLDGRDVYASAEPCPMCLGAVYWARVRSVWFAATRADAAAAGFDDALVYEQIARAGPERTIPFHRVALPEARRPFDAWR